MLVELLLLLKFGVIRFLMDSVEISIECLFEKICLKDSQSALNIFINKMRLLSLLCPKQSVELSGF